METKDENGTAQAEGADVKAQPSTPAETVETTKEKPEKVQEQEPQETKSKDSSSSTKDFSQIVTVDDFNDFVSPQFSESINKSEEPDALKIDMVGSAFIKKLESKLNVIVWDLYHFLVCDASSVHVNLKAIYSAKKQPDTLQVCLPCPRTMTLPFVNRVQTVQSKGSIWFGKLFGVSRNKPIDCFFLGYCLIWLFEMFCFRLSF